MRATLVLGLAMCGCGGAEFQTALFDDAGDPGTPGDAASPPASDAPLTAPLDSSADSSADACPAHVDGFGHAFDDCTDSGLALAYAACIAAGGSRTDPSAAWCTNEDPSPCADKSGYVSVTLDGGCLAWAWSGDLAGEAFTRCGCPASPAASTWR